MHKNNTQVLFFFYSQNHWSNKRRTNGPDPESEYENIHKTMLEKYGPVPEDWQEKWDPGSGRHFYWCTRTGKFLNLALFGGIYRA